MSLRIGSWFRSGMNDICRQISYITATESNKNARCEAKQAWSQTSRGGDQISPAGIKHRGVGIKHPLENIKHRGQGIKYPLDDMKHVMRGN